MATTGPIPGIVIRRLATELALALMAISRSSSRILAWIACRPPAITASTGRASAASSDEGISQRVDELADASRALPLDEAKLHEVTA